MSFILFCILFLGTGGSLQAQSIIKTEAGDHYLAHNAVGTAYMDATEFDPATCLWNIASNQIRPCDATGATLGTRYLKRNGTNAIQLTDGEGAWSSTATYVRYSTTTRDYDIRYNNGWVLARNGGTQAQVYAVTRDVDNKNVPAAYHGSLIGTTALVGAGATSTVTPTATYTEAYSTTTVSYTYSGGTLSSTTTGTVPTPTAVDLTSGWSLSWSLSDATYATISNAGVVTVKSTLPATYATTIVTLTATQTSGTGSFTATMPVTIYASEAVMQQYIVTLDDREDHTWSYYSAKPDAQYPDQLRSPNPRNVKITYRGGSISGASEVAVSATETQNTFVYYKTIERLAWGNSTGRWLTGEYAYRVIPNPFSKRPKLGTTYYGFGGWKIVSGGDHISGHSNGDVLELEEVINFTDLDAGYTANCTSAEVVFEATWVEASVVTATGNVTSSPAALNGSGTYETNFIVFTNGGNKTVSGQSTPVTVSNQYPDGTAAGTSTVSSFTTSTADVKLEYVKIGDGTTPVHPTSPSVNSSTGAGTGTFTANAGELIVGRGCTGTVNYVCSGGSGGKYSFRLESGKYIYMYPMSSGSANANNYGRIVLGCDFDRAADDGIVGNGTGDNTKLRVVNYCSLDGGGAAGVNASELLDITVKSGYYGFSANSSLYTGSGAPDGYGLGIGGNTDNYPGLMGSFTTTGPSGEVTYNYSTDANATGNNNRWRKLLSFYVGPTRGAAKGGVNRMLVEGGEFSSINGGGTNPGNVNTIGYYFRMKGGWVKGAVYGTASISNSSGSRRLVFTGGEVNGWVAGGCNGTDFSAGQGINDGTCYIYAGGRTEFRSHDGLGNYNNAYGLVFNVPGGQIFGAGRGLAPITNGNVKFCGSTTTAYVVVADEAEVEQNVYGGGYNGVSLQSHVYIIGGTVGKKVFGGTAKALTTDHDTDNEGDVWCCLTTDVRMYGGTVIGGVYGGHDETGRQYNDATVQILGGTVGAAGINPETSEVGHVFGSGYGEATMVEGNVSVTIGAADGMSTHQDNPILNGNVYGGGHAAPYNSTGKTFRVTCQNGKIVGNVFGGGKGETAIVTGNTEVLMRGSVNVQRNVYGGGHAANVTGNTHVLMEE